MRIKRRQFLQSATVLAGGIITGTGKTVAGVPGGNLSLPVRIDEPFHGAILNRRLGEVTGGGLKIKVTGDAELRSTVTVNGIPAVRKGTRFESELILHEKETEIRAVAEGWFGQNSHSVRVIWDRDSIPRYRFSVDDNVFFFRDITRRKYRSLFDCFYLSGLRELNRKYGTKFVLHIYYSDGLEYTDSKEFVLSQFPDRYKGEWKDNAGWLKLAFHGHANLPDRPYQYAPPRQLISDMDKVAAEIHRFAGEDTCAPPTTMHWDMVQPPALKALAEKGVRVLSGSFSRSANGQWDCNYFLDDLQSDYISNHDGLMDFTSGIIFSRADMICNHTPVDKVDASLEALARNPSQAEIMDIFTHEQYFWPFYRAYIPDHFQRLEKTLQWLTDHSYKPVFFHEGLMGI